MPVDVTEITDEMIAEHRKRLNIVWKPSTPYFNTSATRDAITHFCHGIGDDNCLYTDSDYAKGTKYGRVIAPPAFLYSVYWAAQGRGMPGVHAWHSGDKWEFYQPILEGDSITYTNEMVDVQVKESQMAGRSVIQYHDIRYYNQRGELVAKALDWCTRAARKTSADKGKYADIQPAEYTNEEMDKIYADYAAEEIRGANPRYWEDVNVGDQLQPVVKGPLTRRDMYAWLIGAGSVFVKAHGLAVSYLNRHQAAQMVDAKTGLVDMPELVHMEDSRAQTVGIPGAYDYGCQRISWLFHLITNWMGDDGFLKNLDATLKRFNIVGDTHWMKGKVARKYIENGEHLVDIECWGENQRGEITLPGFAVVRLPTREGGRG
ncbi:MAG: MaoC family dehydratase N-terminal domain-containing protein [Dehalococcoidia bacterium]|nr:MaoC family dehydratase N-terminal domain-containing protein [Dehalococcoidia bacterium]